LSYNVNNFAVDESQLNDIIYGIKSRDVYQNTRHYPYPCSSDGKVYPLDLLSNNKSDLCVFDLRINLLKLIFGIDYFINSVLTQQFSANLQ